MSIPHFCIHEGRIAGGAHGALGGNIFGMSGLVTDIQGKYIGFIGDRGNGQYPVPFILTPQNLWAWLKT